MRAAWLATLADDIAALHREGRDVLVVSSGAIALGRSRLKLPRGALELEESQAAAAVGQIALARIWPEVLGAHGLGAAQILLTLRDTEERRRYLNARQTIEHAAGQGARCRWSTRTTRWPPPRSATATTTGCPRASPP